MSERRSLDDSREVFQGSHRPVAAAALAEVQRLVLRLQAPRSRNRRQPLRGRGIDLW